MNCNCRAELEDKLVERFREGAPGATDHKASLQGYGFALTGNKMVMRGYMDVAAKARYPLKKGGFKEKTIKQSLFFSYCPFCGVKATEDAAIAKATGEAV